jgi:hypothetical protein
MNKQEGHLATIAALETEISNKIENWRGKRKKWAWTASIFKVSAIIVASTASILLGLKPVQGSSADWMLHFPNIALGLTVTVTAIGALDAFYDPKAVWILYSVALRRLELLKIRLAGVKAILSSSTENDLNEEARKTRAEAVTKLSEMNKEFGDILDNLVKGWEGIRSDPK